MLKFLSDEIEQLGIKWSHDLLGRWFVIDIDHVPEEWLQIELIDGAYELNFQNIWSRVNN